MWLKRRPLLLSSSQFAQIPPSPQEIPCLTRISIKYFSFIQVLSNVSLESTLMSTCSQRTVIPSPIVIWSLRKHSDGQKCSISSLSPASLLVSLPRFFWHENLVRCLPCRAPCDWAKAHTLCIGWKTLHNTAPFWLVFLDTFPIFLPLPLTPWFLQLFPHQPPYSPHEDTHISPHTPCLCSCWFICYVFLSPLNRSLTYIVKWFNKTCFWSLLQPCLLAKRIDFPLLSVFISVNNTAGKSTCHVIH